MDRIPGCGIRSGSVSSGQKLRFDRIDPLRLMLLVVPALVGATFFVIPSAPLVRTLFFCGFAIALLVPLASLATFIDPAAQKIECRRGLVFLSLRVESYPLSDITSISLRDWKSKNSYQDATGNWVPTTNNYVELSVQLKDRSSPLVLIVLDDEKLATSKAANLAELLNFGQYTPRGRVWVSQEQLMKKRERQMEKAAKLARSAHPT